jgi:hypothetical protein
MASRSRDEITNREAVLLCLALGTLACACVMLALLIGR